MSNKQVQITYELFMDLCRYHLLADQDPALEARIQISLEDKMKRAAAREEYGRSIKEAAGSESRCQGCQGSQEGRHCCPRATAAWADGNK